MTARVVHLLRHGAPIRTGLMIGHHDEPPTAAGIAACTNRARGLEVTHIVASDLARARCAAEAIAAERALPLTLDAGWRELDFGAWDGLAPQEIPPEALAAFWRDPEAHAPPGGESWSALRQRIGDALARLPEEPVLVVTHAGAIRAALAASCGFDMTQAWAIDLPYAALLSLRRFPDGTTQITGLRG